MLLNLPKKWNEVRAMSVFRDSLYYSVVNDPACLNSEGHPNTAEVLQLIAIDLAKGN